MAKRCQAFYERFLVSANKYLQENKLEDAERNFANALRQVYDVEGKIFEIATALKGLGYIYSKRGRLNKDGEQIVKATGLLTSSLMRLKQCNNEQYSKYQTEINQLQEEIQSLHVMFITEVLGSQQDIAMKDYEKTESYKEMLLQIRNTCRIEVQTLDKLPNFKPENRNIAAEKKRADLTHQIYMTITKSMRQLITCMINHCFEVMPTPPCKYTVLGLGSTAKEEATPYSDLEFCILTERDTNDVVEYFTHLTHLFHLKVVELGETILPSLGIQSLNDYYSGNTEDDWFLDKGCRGFSFDGAMPWASKVPTGRKKTSAKPCVQSLIKTPRNMASLLSRKEISREGYRLADVLSTCVVICGDNSLFAEYVSYSKATQSSILLQDDNAVLQDNRQETACWKQRILQELIEVERQYRTSLENYIRQPGGRYAIKKDFYRFPSLAIEYLGKFYDTETTSSWETISKLEINKYLSSEAAHNFRTALGIALELRLRAYLDNKSQSEYFSDLLNLVARQDASENLAMLLLRFFFTVVPLEECVRKVCETGNLTHLKDETLYDNNPLCLARLYCQFRQFYKAKDILEKLFRERFQSSQIWDSDQDFATVCKILGNATFSLENASEAAKYNRLALSINEKTYKANPVRSNLKALGDSYLNYGTNQLPLGDRKKALIYLQKALEIRQFLYDQSLTKLEKVTNLQDVLDVLLNMSTCYTSCTTDEISKFFHLNRRALELCEILQQQFQLPYYYHHLLYFKQGVAYYNMGKFKESSEAYHKALEIFHKYKKYDLYTESEASLLNNFANSVLKLGDLEKANELHCRAYEIRRRVHGNRDHDSLARSLNNFGLINEKAGNFKEAHDYYIQAQSMDERIHGANGSSEHSLMYKRNVVRVEKKLIDT